MTYSQSDMLQQLPFSKAIKIAKLNTVQKSSYMFMVKQKSSDHKKFCSSLSKPKFF